MTETLIFLGPSLPRAEAARLAPAGASFLPPAAVGELYRAAAARRPPARIALIDGYFERMAAVWHKEILFALERGIEVFGAASMGALRAAELGHFGMQGIGRIHRGFASGALTDDDEVAVAHLPASHGYRAVSDAMVNLRFTLARARTQQAISRPSHDTLLALAKAMFYPDRTWPALLAAARSARVPAREVARLTAYVASHAVDAKAADARALLGHLARTPVRRPRPTWRLSRTWFWQHFTQLAAQQK